MIQGKKREEGKGKESKVREEQREAKHMGTEKACGEDSEIALIVNKN